jgi:hypothetical protein
MLTHPTLDRLTELGLDGMAKGFRELEANPESRRSSISIRAFWRQRSNPGTRMARSGAG